MLHLLPEAGLYRPDPKSNLYALAIHAGVILALFALASTTRLPTTLQPSVQLTSPVLAPLTRPSHGGGVGGDRSPLPASKGRLAPVATKQFVPPEQALNNLHPKLAIQPTIIAPPDAAMPQVNLENYGNPLAGLGPLSNGPGRNGGIGNGNRGGIGDGNGPGALGNGDCRGIGGNEVYTQGSGISAPVVIYQIDPEYSDEARKAKISGSVLLDLVVDTNGRARSIRVVSGAGLGLDERAIQAVQQWRFKPGTKAGKPVAVRAKVEVNFRLL